MAAKIKYKCADCKYHHCSMACNGTNRNCNGDCQVTEQHQHCSSSVCGVFVRDKYFEKGFNYNE